MSLLGLFGKRSSTSAPSDQLAPAEAYQRLQAGAMLVDVREREEWDSGHATGARHIPLGRLSSHLAGLPRDRDVLFICQSGNRSNLAMRRARSAGLTNTLNVRGGTSAWYRAGLPMDS